MTSLLEKDFFHLSGQDNTFRYLPIGKLLIRIHPDDNLFEILARIAAAQIAKCKVVVSIPQNLETKKTKFLEQRQKNVTDSIYTKNRDESSCISGFCMF